MRALFPLEDDGADAVVVNTGGGVVGGDRIEVAITVDAGTSALVTSQAAEKVYRSAGPLASIATSLAAGPGATLAWLPQETILFDGSRLQRRLSIELAPDACLLAGEMLVFGRLAHGERLARAELREAWDVRIGGRLRWADRFRLAPPNQPSLDHPALLDGARAMATLVHAAPDAAARLDAARTSIEPVAGIRAGVSLVNGLLVARLAGAEPRAVRRALAALMAAWREAFLGGPRRLPRLWAI